MPEPVTCLDCGMTDPPPEQTCHGGTPGGELRDHFVGDDRGCPNCGRLMAACARRPCSVMRDGKDVPDFEERMAEAKQRAREMADRLSINLIGEEDGTDDA
jgi:hypothetical protein